MIALTLVVDPLMYAPYETLPERQGASGEPPPDV